MLLELSRISEGDMSRLPGGGGGIGDGESGGGTPEDTRQASLFDGERGVRRGTGRYEPNQASDGTPTIY